MNQKIKFADHTEGIDLEELTKLFLPFEKKILRQIHKFEKENTCRIIFDRDQEMIFYLNLRNLKST